MYPELEIPSSTGSNAIPDCYGPCQSAVPKAWSEVLDELEHNLRNDEGADQWAGSKATSLHDHKQADRLGSILEEKDITNNLRAQGFGRGEEDRRQGTSSDECPESRRFGTPETQGSCDGGGADKRQPHPKAVPKGDPDQGSDSIGEKRPSD